MRKGEEAEEAGMGKGGKIVVEGKKRKRCDFMGRVRRWGRGREPRRF
jgi:hypothetical protein